MFSSVDGGLAMIFYSLVIYIRSLLCLCGERALRTAIFAMHIMVHFGFLFFGEKMENLSLDEIVYECWVLSNREK